MKSKSMTHKKGNQLLRNQNNWAGRDKKSKERKN